MRIILNKKRSDHVLVEDMLKEVGFLSVNRTLAHVEFEFIYARISNTNC